MRRPARTLMFRMVFRMLFRMVFRMLFRMCEAASLQKDAIYLTGLQVRSTDVGHYVATQSGVSLRVADYPYLPTRFVRCG